jgi:hypothetical protein
MILLAFHRSGRMPAGAAADVTVSSLTAHAWCCPILRLAGLDQPRKVEIRGRALRECRAAAPIANQALECRDRFGSVVTVSREAHPNGNQEMQHRE